MKNSNLSAIVYFSCFFSCIYNQNDLWIALSVISVLAYLIIRQLEINNKSK